VSEPRARWRVCRAGLINVFEYGEQVFEFGGGRLLLRGPNGSGKSKAMELLFPFLFEGDMAAAKLDPFGKRARKMKWNLLMDGKHERRTGYAWFELRHDDPRQTPQYATFGVCLDAHREWDDVKPRFFHVAGKRVGHDFELVDDDRRPLGRRQLHELMSGLGGETFVQANSYQERLNQVAFGYPSLKRLGQQIRLQRTLRRPQLSDTLDEQLLNELLSDALPEIDGDLLTQSSRRLDQIEESRVRLETLKRNEAAVRAFAVTYASYARAELRERRDAFREAAAAIEAAQTDYDEHDRELAAAQTTLEGTLDELAQTQAELERLRAAERTLLSSPEMKAADELARARERLARARSSVERAAEQHAQAAAELARAETGRDEQERQLNTAVARFKAELERLGDLAEAAGVAAHAQLAAALAGEGETDSVVDQLERAVRERRAQIDEVRRLRAIADDKAGFARKRAEVREQARERAGDARAGRVEAERSLAAERVRLGEQLGDWADALEQTAVVAELRARLEEVIETAGAPESERLADILAVAFAVAEAAVASAELELDRLADRLAEEKRPLEEERATLESGVDPVPAPVPTRSPREDGRPGASFWRLVEFNEGLGESERAGIEGGLEGAGLLDAWVLPSGELLAAGSDDVALIPVELGGGPTLADHLHPAPGELPVDPDVLWRILRSITVGGGEGGGCFVGLDGGFAFGPARGAHPKHEAQFIGAAARAANRARRLAELAEALAHLAVTERELEQRREAIAGRRHTIAAERAALPSEQPARQAHAALVRARQAEEGARRAFDDAEQATIESERGADLARGDVEVFAGRHRLDPTGNETALRAVADQLDRYSDTLGQLRHADFDRRSALGMIEQLTTSVHDHGRRLLDRAADLQHAEAELHEAEGRAGGLEALSGDAERALEQAAELKGQIDAADARSSRLGEARADLSGQIAKLEERRTRAAEQVAGAERRRHDAVSSLASYVRADLLGLALGDRALVPGREQALAWNQSDWLEFFAGVTNEALATRGGREHLMNTLDRDYETLRQQVDAGQLQISREHVEGLLVVRGYAHGSEQSLATLIDSLVDEVAESERRLSEDDRRLFEEFVTGGLADHLHQRINEAKQTVERMNEEIAKVQASSGMSIDIHWQRADAGGTTLRRALELLQAAPSRLTPDEQRELQEFVREQVRSARIEAAENETTLAQLERALDYRRWHTFKLRKKSGSGAEARDLTRHEHDSGSGGEKAISLHLPLLAAAASYPASGKPDALRMVMLDEAFTRIDDEGRRGIMGLISKFDLDIMLTSPEYWGCCAEVPELDIYVLAPRDASAPGVVARHFHWDGERRALVDDPPPRHGNGKVELVPQLDDGQLDLDGHAPGGGAS